MNEYKNISGPDGAQTRVNLHQLWGSPPKLSAIIALRGSRAIVSTDCSCRFIGEMRLSPDRWQASFCARFLLTSAYPSPMF